MDKAYNAGPFFSKPSIILDCVSVMLRVKCTSESQIDILCKPNVRIRLRDYKMPNYDDACQRQ
jgi:hypothetical protein